MSSDKQSAKGGVILMVTTMLAGMLMGAVCMQTVSSRRSARSGVDGKLGEVLRLVEREYVDQVATDSLGELLVSAMLADLDPHSNYISAKESEAANERYRGSFEGVGIILHREGDSTFVGSVMEGGPSDGLGFLPGDALVSANGVDLTGLPADSVVAALRGRRGTTVSVALVHFDGRADTIRVRRGVVEQNSVVCCDMLDDTTGYIMLSSFTSASHREFRDALSSLFERGMWHLVLDLRGNPGGAFESAIGIAGEFLPGGSLIVYTEGAHSKRHSSFARRDGMFTNGRVSVLVDENSASASEVVSGALQDNDRATIYGRRTFGKGLVQRSFTLDDGSMVYLTVSRYYTPSGRCIQRPYTDGTDEYYRSYMQLLLDEVYADTAVASVVDSTPYYTVHGRTVYGGGGIIPDVILPYRNDPSFVYYNKLEATAVIRRAAFAHVRRNVSELYEKYPTAEAFRRKFTTSDEMVRSVARLGEEVGIAVDEASLAKQRRLIGNMFKAFVGQSLYGDGLFYTIVRQEDDDIK